MHALRALAPGYTECLFVLKRRDDSVIRVYVEASSPSDALLKYAALPVEMQEGPAHSAVKVSFQIYVPGRKTFYRGFFKALGHN